MARPKKQDRLAGFTKPFHEPLPAAFCHIRTTNLAMPDVARDAALLRHAAQGDKGAGLLGGRKFAHPVEIAGIEGLDKGGHGPAATLAEIRTQRPYAQ